MINLRQNNGFALTFALIFLFLIVSFMGVFMLTVANGVSMANRSANLKKAYYVAEAGLVDAYERITQAGRNIVIPTPGSPFIPSPSTDNGVYAIGNATGNYTVTIAVTATPRTNYTITSTGTFGSATRTLQLQMTWSSISQYAYWSQTENNPAFGGGLWWVGVGLPGLEMITTGPVQTNGTLNIFGNPIFNGAVAETNGDGGTTPNYYYGIGNSGLQSDPNIIFPNSITNQAPAINLPVQSTLQLMNSVASDGQGLVLTGGPPNTDSGAPSAACPSTGCIPSTVLFNPDGTITVTGKVVNSGCQVTTVYNNTVLPAPPNGVVYIQSANTIPQCNLPSQNDGNVKVQGTVSGQLTVAADQNILITGSVAYNDPPPRLGVTGGDPKSNDLVGLVASQNITVVAASAPAQLELSAVLMAIQGSFQVDQWTAYKGDANTAVMDQFGSLVNYVDGATGAMDLNGNLEGGWNQIQSYDPRLLTMAPPGFPPLINSSGNAEFNKLSITEI
jgi:Tfp pilus assembly protein PilX